MEHEFERQLRTLAIERRPEACLGCGFEHGCSVHGCAVIHAAAERLAAYEETRLEPEDMKKAFNEDATLKLTGQALGMSPDRLRELAQAEKTGRLVVLPCKDWFEIVFGEQELFWGIDTDYIETPIREISVDNAERFTWYDGWKTLVLRGNDENGLDWEFSPEDVGKTVFLTREAAEAALDAMGGENNA